MKIQIALESDIGMLLPFFRVWVNALGLMVTDETIENDIREYVKPNSATFYVVDDMGMVVGFGVWLWYFVIRLIF